LLELHGAKEHQIELLALLERELVLVAPRDRHATEAEIVYVTKEIDRLTLAILEHRRPVVSEAESSGIHSHGEGKAKTVVHWACAQ
jgi:hypothetical protein